MDVLVLNTDFELVGIVDYYKSLIWTERYSEAGDFEIYLRGDSSLFSVIRQGYYLQLKGSEQVMMIEQIEIETNIEDGNEITISGRSLEAILERRIIWPQTNLDGNFQNGIKRLITEALINPTDAERRINNFIFEESDDENITKLTIDAQYTGDNLYEVICKVCQAYNIGFRIYLSEDNKFIFKLIRGQDRSYSQEANEYVIFSPKYDNLISSNYLESKKPLKTVGLVAGEGEGVERKFCEVYTEETHSVGLERREVFIDARDVSSNTNEQDENGNEIIMTEEEYYARLEERGIEKLVDYKESITFEGEVENGQTFIFGEHYFIGDVVQIVNEYGMQAKSRVVEVVRSVDTGGIQFYPTFTAVVE